jgi:PAS domain S-box-containing protein
MLFIVLCSTILQFIAGFLALRLIAFAGRKWAWSLLSAGIFAMAFRRAHTLVGIYNGSDIPSFSYELLGLVISILVYAGVSMIGPFIRGMKELAERLAESEERYRTVAEFTFDWEYWLGPDGSFIYVSPACERITGYTPQEFMDNPDLFVSVVHPDYRETMSNTAAALNNLQKPMVFDFKIIDRQGQEHWIAHSSLPVYSDQGVFLGIRASARNIDHRKRLEQELLESRTLYKSLVENARCLVLRLDRHGVISFANAYAEEHFEIPGDELTSMRITSLLASGAESEKERTERDQLLGELSRSIEAGERMDFECENAGRDGTRFWGEWNNSPVSDEFGGIKAFICVGIDVTRRKILDKLKEDVSRIIRHDLKSPLSGIIGIPRILRKDENITPRQAEMLKAVEETGQMMLNLIDQSLELYKLESGSYEFHFEEFDVIALLRDVVRTVQMGKEHPVPIRVTIDGRTFDEERSIPMTAERPLIFSMLNNLIKNAVEASEGKPVIVDMNFDKGCRFSISNAGEVPKAIQSRFFDKYATEGKRGGTGLGTYSARLTAEKHGGSISMQSAAKLGTTVTVVIPPMDQRAGQPERKPSATEHQK